MAAFSPEEFSALGFRLVEATSGAHVYFRHHPQFGSIEATCITSMMDLEADLLRRDFAINAMAMSLTGVRVDPLGGEADLQSKVLRACSAETFSGDPLRIFRAFRFEADGWCMAPETATLIRKQQWTDAFSTMPVERFTNEMRKALSRDNPERFFERMIEFNVGTAFLPELFRMPSIPAGPLQHHPEGDLFSHSIQVLQRVTAASHDPLTRFCAFFHDLGKLSTDPALYPKHHGHDHAGFETAPEFCNRLALPATYRKALAWVSRLHGTANLWETLRDSTKIRMAEQAIKSGIVEILPVVSAADTAGGMTMAGWDHTIQVAGMNMQELGIDQEKLDVMPIKKRSTFIQHARVEKLRELRGEADGRSGAGLRTSSQPDIESY